MSAGQEEHPDQRYIRGLLEKDETICGEIIARFYPPVKTYVLKNSGDADDAYDLFKNTLVILMKQAKEGLEINSSFQAYLMRICKLRWINELRRRRRFDKKNEDPPEPASDDNFFRNMLAYERQLLFRKHFAQLPERCRQILQLRFEEYNLREIAEQLQLNHSFVRRRSGECTKQLIDNIQQDPLFGELK
ncbi:MAG: sigma-70 family RNA polymerase sigma factor [Saprospiraceae bacterium]